MPIVATPRWSEFQHQPGYSSTISFDVVGTDDSLLACTANGVFRQNDDCPWDGLLSAASPVATRPGFNLWRVTQSFAPRKAAGSSGGPNADPLKQPIKFRWNFGNTSEPFDRDNSKNKNLIVNTAGEPDEAPYQKDVRSVGFTVTKNFAPETDFFELNASYQDKLNEKEVQLFNRYKMKKQTLRCTLFVPLVEFDFTARYIPAAATFEYRADGWQVRKKSVGRNGWMKDKNGVMRLSQLYDWQNNPVSTPIPLKIDGTPLNDGYTVGFNGPAPLPNPYPFPKDADVETSPDGSIFMLWIQYTAVDFAPLNKILA